MRPQEKAERKRVGSPAIVSLVMAQIYDRFNRLLERNGVLKMSTPSGSAYFCTVCSPERPPRLRALRRSRKGQGGNSRRLKCSYCQCVYVPSGRVKMHPEDEGGDWAAYLNLDPSSLRI